jgi:uncharacterized protein
MNDVFLDTAFAIALSSKTDRFHQAALQLAEELESARTRLVTTRAVLTEIGNALARQHFRDAAVRLLDSLERDANVEIIPISEDLWHQGFQMFRERPDKEWGLTDCVSFIVMQERKMKDALTTDEHFVQAGFRALLRESL